MLGAYPIGIYGIAKTVVGYGASSLGAKLDVENAGARLLVTLGFYLVHAAVYFTVARGMVNLTLNWSWSRGILAGLANAVLGVGLYFLLDNLSRERKTIQVLSSQPERAVTYVTFRPPRIRSPQELELSIHLSLRLKLGCDCAWRVVYELRTEN